MQDMKQTIHTFTEFMKVICNNQDLKEPNCCEDCKKIYYGNKCPICGKDNVECTEPR